MDRAGTYEDSVFINCPFDSEYWPLFEAITFSVYECGFLPRCALEVDDSSQVRIHKITEMIRGCRLSIHDISRTESDGDPPLPRFNMPLELGMFMGAKAYGVGEQKRKAGMILDAEKYRFQRYISDIAGQDIRAHAGEPDVVIRHVRNFLLTQSSRPEIISGPEKIIRRFHQFRAELPTSCAAMHVEPSDMSFQDLLGLVVGYSVS
jgi:hypothetical protein